MELIELLENLKFDKNEIDIILNTNIDSFIDVNKVTDNLANSLETASKEEANLANLFKDDKDGLKLLKVMLLASLKTYKKFQEKNIPDNIFFDTMGFFKRSTDEYRSYTENRFGFDRSSWVVRQLTLNLFRIGTLEYEFGHTPELNNEIVIHIPSNADLTPNVIDESLAKLHTFLNNYYKDYKYERICTTCWMLSPILKELLPSDSKIIKFQNRFNILETFDSDEYLIWIYNNQKCELKDLICTTSLQFKLKEYLLKGNKFKEGFGILK